MHKVRVKNIYSMLFLQKLKVSLTTLYNKMSCYIYPKKSFKYFISERETGRLEGVS